MTAEALLVVLLAAAAALAAAVSALILAAFGETGWFVLAALIVTGAFAGRLVVAHLASHAASPREDLRDDWRIG